MDASPPTESFWVNVTAGAAASLVGLTSFGIFHTIWILDVPAVFFEGLLFLIPTSVAMAWAIRLARQVGRFTGGLEAGLVVGLLFWLSLIPYEVVGALWGPWQDPTSFSEVLGLGWIAFLGVPVGAAIGWGVTRRRSGAVAWGIAALAAHLMLGGSIAFFGGRSTMLGLFWWLLPTHLLAGVALVRVHELFGSEASAARSAGGILDWRGTVLDEPDRSGRATERTPDNA